MNKKFFILLSLVLLFIPYSSIFATTTYEYIIDNANLFDDSNYMTMQAKNLRSKLDVNIHIYSVKQIDQAEEIFEKYVQDSAALIIVVSEDKSVDWYTGSVTKKCLRDLDMEDIIASNPILDKQYTAGINKILQIITICCIGEDNVVVDKENPIPKTKYNPQPKYIKKQILISLFSIVEFVAIVVAGYLSFNLIYQKLREKKEEKREKKEKEEEEMKHILETPLNELADEYEKKKENNDNRQKSVDLELEKLKQKYDSK